MLSSGFKNILPLRSEVGSADVVADRIANIEKQKDGNFTTEVALAEVYHGGRSVKQTLRVGKMWDLTNNYNPGGKNMHLKLLIYPDAQCMDLYGMSPTLRYKSTKCR